MADDLMMMGGKKMLIRCAWCKTDMGEKEPLEDSGVTHGICDECLQVFRNELKEEEVLP